MGICYAYSLDYLLYGECPRNELGCFNLSSKAFSFPLNYSFTCKGYFYQQDFGLGVAICIALWAFQFQDLSRGSSLKVAVLVAGFVYQAES